MFKRVRQDDSPEDQAAERYMKPTQRKRPDIQIIDVVGIVVFIAKWYLLITNL